MTYALVTCSGVSNVGKLTTQAAQVLLQRTTGQYIWMHARQSTTSLQLEIGDADELRIAPDHHIIATELGVEKKGMGEVQYDEIEIVVRAVMEIGSKK